MKLFHNRLVALLLILTLQASILPSYAAQNVSSPAQLVIPEALGSVDEVHTAGEKVIIFIQDAHDSLEAQENIAKLIDYLVDKENVQTVFEEGYEGPVPTDEYFGFIKDPAEKQKVSYFFLDKLRIGGAEYAHINRKKDFKLIGADNIKQHLENIRCYRRAAKHKRAIEEDFAAMSKELDQMVNLHFPKELKEWIKIKKRLDSQQLNLSDYVKRIKDQINLSQYPSLKLFVESEKADSPEMQQKLKEIKAQNLIGEIDRAEDEFAAKFLKEKSNHTIFHYYKVLELLKRLNEIQISSEEFDLLKKWMPSFNTQIFADFVVSQTRRSVVLSKRWEKDIKYAVDFYKTARDREKSTEEALKAFASNESETKAVLIFGGFHKNTLKTLFEKYNYFYYVISPRINELDPRHQAYYKRLMSVGYHDFEVPHNLPKANRPPTLFGEPVLAEGN